jgi:hypothetical protein
MVMDRLQESGKDRWIPDGIDSKPLFPKSIATATMVAELSGHDRKCWDLEALDMNLIPWML